MAKTATIDISVNPRVKSDAESVFSSLGVALTEAIDVFLRKSVTVGGLLFNVRQPRHDDETEAAIAEARGIMSGKAWAIRSTPRPTCSPPSKSRLPRCR